MTTMTSPEYKHLMVPDIEIGMFTTSEAGDGARVEIVAIERHPVRRWTRLTLRRHDGAEFRTRWLFDNQTYAVLVEGFEF